MNWDYSENILVQESAGNQLHDELGWDVVFAYNQEVLGENGTLGRKSYKDILLEREVRAALKRLNPWISNSQTDEAIRILRFTMSSQSLLQINEDKYRLILEGIKVSDKKPDGSIGQRTAILIDFNPENIDKNHFLAVKEMKIHGSLYRRRTDIVGFVNGIPLLFIELKRNDVDVEEAYTKNYTDYLDTIPHLFYYNAFLMLSNGEEAKVGTLGSKYEFFHEWKRLSEDEELGCVDLQTMLRGICNKRNFLDLLENFILFDHSEGTTVKILARNHQYLGVNEAIKAYEERKLRDGKLGVFWHTQGSGKSYSMLFLSQKIRNKFEGSPTIVILTDRDELNTQISDTFLGCNLLGTATKSAPFIASSGEDLIKKLKGNPSYIFTLIQKFNKPDAEPIIPDHDIIIMSDEAHRSQYGLFAENMCRLLPTASRIGFTGTPLMSDDNITERTFGGYVSIYDFKRAVDDHATVPLFYENRGQRIEELKDIHINQRILDAIERADLDPSQQEKLEREFAKDVHLLTSDPIVDKVAKDFVNHYTDLWTSGKAMVVCLRKETCVKMYEYAQRYWAEIIEKTKHEIDVATSDQEQQELKRKLHWLEETEMAVVVSQDQNEVQTFKKWGFDIKPHREKMEKRKLDKEFKNSQKPLRIVFVCAMWLTGFDVKSLSCLYLFKPLKAHTLMQTIARANRVADGKSNGLIIDYIGIVRELEQALADYTRTKGGQGSTSPTVDKSVLIDQIYKTVAAMEQYLFQHEFKLQDLIDAKDFTKLALLKTAANAMCETLEIKKTYQGLAYELVKMMKYIDRGDLEKEIRPRIDALKAIYAELQKKRKHADNTDLLVELNHIISDYIEVGDMDQSQHPRFDISKIDFDILQKEFAKTKKKNLVMKDLADIIEKKVEDMMEENPSRINFYEKYQEIIKAYNSDHDKSNIEKTFMELISLSKELSEEEQRYVREGFSNEEELAMYDLLLAPNLSKEDIKKLKVVASDLLHKIKEKIAQLHNWTDKQETRASIELLIRDVLWYEMPESYTDQQINQYRQKVYEYCYERYPIVAA